MPKMPELKWKDLSGFTPVDIDTDSIAFKDKNRERQRQKLLEQRKADGPVRRTGRKTPRNQPWSKQKAKKEKKRKLVAKRKREEGSDLDNEDMEELLNDTRLLKKLKRGKISEKEFEKTLLGSRKGGSGSESEG